MEEMIKTYTGVQYSKYGWKYGVYYHGVIVHQTDNKSEAEWKFDNVKDFGKNHYANKRIINEIPSLD